MPAAPSPPLSLTAPHATPAEIGAALRYLDWLAEELSTKTNPGSRPELVGSLLSVLVGVALASVVGKDGMLVELFNLVSDFAGRQMSGVAGMTVREAVGRGLDLGAEVRSAPSRN